MPTAIAPITGVALPGATGRATPAPATAATTGKGLSAWQGDSFSFGDLIDVINPLQHLPVIGTIYRAITGDEIGVAPRLAGSTLYGGPLGFMASLVDTAITDITGKSASDYLVAAVEDILPGGAAGEAVAENHDGADGTLVRTGHHAEAGKAAPVGDDNWYDDEPAGTDVAEITGQSADDPALAEMDFDEVPHFYARIERLERSRPPARDTAVAEASVAHKPVAHKPAAPTSPATSSPAPGPALGPAPKPIAARRAVTAPVAPGPAFVPSRPVPLTSRALPAAQIMAASPRPAPQFSVLPSNRGPADPAAFTRLLSAAQGDHGTASRHGAPLAASATIARALARYGAAGAAMPPLPPAPLR